MQRSRKANTDANGGQPLPGIPTDLNFEIPERFINLILFDSGTGADRLIMLGCHELLDGLARAEVWLADGTFKVVPSIFFQMYSIHFSFQAGINPAALYCLLTNKTSDTYTRILEELQRLIPLAAPRTILLDFERAAMNAFEAAFPNATITGCYFHLCQSIVRKV